MIFEELNENLNQDKMITPLQNILDDNNPLIIWQTECLLGILLNIHKPVKKHFSFP